MSKNFFDDNGKYHNVQNLTLEQIYANGYAAGYDQAQKNFVEELEKIKTEIYEQKCFNKGLYCKSDLHQAINIINKHIYELKGENNES